MMALGSERTCFIMREPHTVQSYCCTAKEASEGALAPQFQYVRHAFLENTLSRSVPSGRKLALPTPNNPQQTP